ncbi:MAG: 2-phosphosulfolactate phosphatase [Chitinophagia bacterium]|nr:2-phosphosulfolactate phosphatase [Chitinophagia bacterium]
MKPTIEVCLSPALLHLYNTEGKNVVVIDIFRATSTIVTALHNGAIAVKPVDSVAECIALSSQWDNAITAGERDGKVAPGLQYGNSPLEYNREFIQGKVLILTTTNGTRLLYKITSAANIFIGSFLNLEVLCDKLLTLNGNILLACASWKDKVNLEDSLFAGAVAYTIGHYFDINCDSARMVRHLFAQSMNVGLLPFLKESSHYKRLAAYGLTADMEYCLTPNLHPNLPLFYDGWIKTIA